jgi:limonene 1,2-monooxygenase
VFSLNLVANCRFVRSFGIFLGPYHPMNDNPTVAFQRDLELVQWLDDLAFDEAYIGEHHSGGWETISSPEVFIAALADRTKSIKLGTGVLSLPYHHPLMAANRLVLLDHITRGRLMIGVGPGGLNADAYMMGIDTTVQRARMEEALDVLIRLFTETEPISHESDWFKLQDAHLQVRPYQRPHPPIAVSSIHSPAGVALAGKHGTSVLSMSIDQDTDLSYQWGIAEESAARHGQTVRRENWRMVMPVHVAETRQQAFDDIRSTAGIYQREYLEHTLTLQIGDTPIDRIVEEMSESGSWIVGSPDDCIRMIHNLDKRSGGFGGLLAQGIDWAPRQRILNSYELIARYVAPQFQNGLVGLETSNRWSQERAPEFISMRDKANERAQEDYRKRAQATA